MGVCQTPARPSAAPHAPSKPFREPQKPCSEVGWKQRNWGNTAFHLEGCSCLVLAKEAISSEWQRLPWQPLYSLFCLTSKLGGNKNSQRIVPMARRSRYTPIHLNIIHHYLAHLSVPSITTCIFPGCSTAWSGLPVYFLTELLLTAFLLTHGSCSFKWIWTLICVTVFGHMLNYLLLSNMLYKLIFGYQKWFMYYAATPFLVAKKILWNLFWGDWNFPVGSVQRYTHKRKYIYTYLIFFFSHCCYMI